MITFSCAACGRQFEVADAFAGRRARCKGCGGPMVVPPAPRIAGVLPAAVLPAMLPVRTRRLIADNEQLARAFVGCEMICASPVGKAPSDRFQVTYHVRGVESLRDDKPLFRDEHRMEIQFTSQYPQIPPQCRMLTPIFHPNIDAASICIGDHWTAGQRVAHLVVRVAEMIAYQAYNTKSPLNGEAAMWADLHSDVLPVDARNLMPPTLE